MKSTRHTRIREVFERRAATPQLGGIFGNSGPHKSGFGSDDDDDDNNDDDDDEGSGRDDPFSTPTVKTTTSKTGTTLVVKSTPTKTSTSRSSSSKSSTTSVSSSKSSTTSLTSTSTTTSSTRTSTTSSNVVAIPTAGPSVIPAAASTSPTAQLQASKSHTNVGAIVGGLLAAGVAIAILVALYLRRKRRAASGFDSSEFRRSAMVLNDPPPPQFGNTGYMSEKQREANLMRSPIVPSYSSPPYGNEKAYEPFNMESGAGQPAPAYPSAFSAHPTHMTGDFNDSYHAQQPYMPILPPQSFPASQRGAPTSVDLARQYSNQEQYLARNVTVQQEDIPADDFVDLSRSSVSPFQAAQYLAISQKLNTPPVVDRDLPPIPPPEPGFETKSPFDDPEPSSGTVDEVLSRSQSLSGQSISGDSIMPSGLDFPLPPVPSQPAMTRYRVDSSPPTLPDLNIQARGLMNSPATNHFKLEDISLSTPETRRAPSPPEPAVMKPDSGSDTWTITPEKSALRLSMFTEDDAYGGY